KSPAPRQSSESLARVHTELCENLRIVLAQRGRRCIDARAAMRKCKSCDRNAEAAVNAVAGLVVMNNAAGLDLWIGHRLTHRAYARRRHVAGTQEDLPFVGGARKHDLAQHCRFALAVGFTLFV